ncbi:MAG: translation initiation factor IF-6 [Methanophagales archaeon ANME-1-THS]|nr:MAG: translation initiation factor IF-6 [Methanophagales archaeon ANME-1-THS]
MKRRGEQEITRLFSVDGSSYIGVFASCTESLVLLPSHISNTLATKMERALAVKAVRTSIAGSSLVGCLAVGNTNGFIFSPYALDSELRKIREFLRAQGLRAKLSRLPAGEKMTAAGNIILANDTVALVHPQVSEKTVDLVAKTLGVRVYKGTIGGLKTVGMAAVATNKGILAHKNATREELEFLEESFELPVEIGSVNLGVPLIGAALLANTKGYAVGYETTGAELGRIEDALGF